MGSWARGTAFVLHAQRGSAGGCGFAEALAPPCEQRLNPLAMAELALSVLVESSSIAIAL
jgi:hypothetical protein